MAMERIFAHFKDQTSASSSAYDPADQDSYDQYIHAMMADALDYEDSILATGRSEAQLYYYGYEPWIGPYNPGEPYIGEDPTATLGEILNRDNKDQPNRSTLRLDRRPRCGDDDAAEPDPSVRRPRGSGLSGAAHRGRGRPGRAGD